MRNSRKIGYAAGDMGISISYFAVGFFFMYYLTDIVGMDPLLAGTAFFIGKLWDGINDPLMGIISDRTKSRLGRKRVYILFGSLPFALSFMLLWMIPATAGKWMQFALAAGSLTLFTTFYTVVVVPYMSMVPVMTSDYDERTQITGMRAIFSSIGTILGGGAAFMLTAFTNETVGLRTITGVFALLAFLSLIAASWSTRGIERNDDQRPIVQAGASQYLRLLADGNLRILLAVKILGAVATGCLTAALPYFAEHVLGDKGVSTIGLAVYVLLTAISIPLWNKLTKKWDKRRLLLAANVLAAVVLAAIGFGINAAQTKYFYAGCGVLGFALAAYVLIPYSLVPDMVDYYEYKTYERHESVFFGLWITVHQLGAALAGLVLGVSLNLSGYGSQAGQLTDTAAAAVRIAFGVIPGLFLIITGLVLQRYGITRQVYQRVRKELELRAQQS